MQREAFDVAAQLARHEERALITTATANVLDGGAALGAECFFSPPWAKSRPARLC